MDAASTSAAPNASPASSAAQPATNWAEQVAPGETALFDHLANQLRELQRARTRKHPAGRALHFKPHAALRAEFTTLAETPAWTRVGIFASPGTYRAYVRFSNGGVAHKADAEPDVRGIAVKVVGVPGRKLIEGMRDAKTQDFLAILSPSTPFRTPGEFVGVVRAANGNPLLALPRIIGALGLRRMGSVLGQLKTGLAAKVDSLAGQTFYSALPIRWGDYAVKYSLAPRSAPAAVATENIASAPDRLAREFAARIARGTVEYDFRVQGFVDEARTPIEDSTVAWDESVAPWVTVARLTLAQQDSASPAGKRVAEYVEKLSFDPWHAPEEFRPLGALMRARSSAYRESVMERAAAPEPDGSEAWE